MQISDELHRSRPWRVHELAPDFPLHDAWRFEIEGSADDFDEFLRVQEQAFTARSAGRWSAAGLLFRLREAMSLLDADPGLPRVRERIGGDRESSLGPFELVYREPDECLHEICNRTVHALLHLGWVETDDGWSPEMAVYVKPQGWLGRGYMALINPFRHLIVYPTLMRRVREAWTTRTAEPGETRH
ncbi:MAG: DUF2867 domain-containing protein [Acidobacteriota bacterium]